MLSTESKLFSSGNSPLPLPHTAHLTGANIAASDLRAGAALVVAALMANGESIVEKLTSVGAKIVLKDI